MNFLGTDRHFSMPLLSGSGQVGGPTDWLESGMATVLADLNNQGVSSGQQIAQPAIANLMGTAPYLQQSGDAYLGTYMQNMQNPIENAAGVTNQNYQNLLGQGTQGYQNALTNAGTVGMGAAGTNLYNFSNNLDNTLGGTLGQLAPTANQAGTTFANGGMTPQLQSGYNAIAQLLGQQTPGLQTSAGTANNLIGNTGSNSFNQALEQMALSSAASGGANPASTALLNAANPLLSSQGANATTQGLTGQGANLFNQTALMNPAQAAGLARNQAGTANAQAEQQMMQQALNRGGGPGATVANGLQNQTAADFATQNAQSVSNAVTQALQNQQQLQLSQQGLGENALQQGGSLQNALLGTAGSLGQGSGSLATNLLNAYLNGGGTGSANQLGMLGQGGNLASMLQSGQLGGISGLNNLVGTQTGYQTGMGNLQNSINSMLSTNALGGNNALGNLYNEMYGTGISSGNLNNSILQNLGGLLNSNYQTAEGFGSGLTNIYNAGTNPLQAIMQGGLGLTGTGLSGQSQLFGGSSGAIGNQPSLFSSLLGAGSALGQAGIKAAGT